MRPSRRPTLMVAKKVITKLLERFKRWGEVIASRSLRCSLLTPLSSRVLSSVHNSVSLFQSGNNKAEALQTAPPKVSKKLRKKYRKICALLVDNFNDRISFFLRFAARHIAEAIYVALGAGTCALHDAIDNNRHDRYGMLHRCTFFRWPSPPFRHIKVFPRVSRFSGFEVIVSNRFILLPAIFFFFFLIASMESNRFKTLPRTCCIYEYLANDVASCNFVSRYAARKRAPGSNVLAVKLFLF